MSRRLEGKRGARGRELQILQSSFHCLLVHTTPDHPLCLKNHGSHINRIERAVLFSTWTINFKFPTHTPPTHPHHITTCSTTKMWQQKQQQRKASHRPRQQSKRSLSAKSTSSTSSGHSRCCLSHTPPWTLTGKMPQCIIMRPNKGVVHLWLYFA